MLVIKLKQGKRVMQKILISFLNILCIIFFVSPIVYARNTRSASELQPLHFVVATALSQNPDVLKSIVQTAASQAAIRAAQGGFFPKVDIDIAGGAEETENNSTSNTDATLARKESGIVITQPVFSGFTTYNLVHQRRYEAKSAFFNQAFTKEEISFQSARVYLDLLRLKYLRALTTFNILVHRKYLNKVRCKYRGGAGRKTSVDLALGRLEQRRITLQTVVGAQRNAVTNFAQVVGMMPQRLTLPKAPPVPKTLLRAKNVALAINPRLMVSRENLNAADSSVAVAKGKLLPTVNVQFIANNNRNIGGINGSAKNARAMAVLSYNIFNGATDKANIDRARELRMAAMYTRNSVRLKVIESVTQAWDKLRTDRISLVILKRRADATRHVLYGYRKQFKIGKRSLLNLLDMENELFNVRAAIINSRFAIRTDKYNLLASMGSLVHYFAYKG
ncbi:MAG: TolC family protein [Gammaproteobacteria bacterium]|nr:TolC family protein [Gammaproteobacteria bacterium]